MMTLNRKLRLVRSNAVSRITVARQAQHGVTLIELMIAIVIGMVIVLALTTLFVNISRTNSEMAKTNAQIENGRFAMQLLGGDIVHAGYWGGYVPQFDDMTIPASGVGAYDANTMKPTYVPNPCRPYNAPNWNDEYKRNLLAIPIQSYDGALANCGITAKAGTDVLVVGHVQTCVPGEPNCDAASTLYFQPSYCESEIDAGNRYVLDYVSAASAVLPASSVASVFPLHKRNCSDFADKRKFISNIYYVSDVNGVPTLMRSSFDGTAHGTAVPLIEGIEGFRVELGIDSVGDASTDADYTKAAAWAEEYPTPRETLLNRGDGIPDGAFVHCATSGCTLDQLDNVVAVKLYVLARNKEPTVGYTDNKSYTLGSVSVTIPPADKSYKRHVFSTTVRLNNVSGRRETP